MRILAIGDIVASNGLHFVDRHLFTIKKQYNIDFCIANAENVCSNNGINKEKLEILINRGVDVITLGNHAFANKECFSLFEDNSCLIRPLNYPPQTPGEGYVIMDTPFARVAVINALGRIFMDPLDCPFRMVDNLLNRIAEKVDIILIDFHAEATSEKAAFAHFLDGRVSAVFGTHTHVQTADERILPGGTAFISDLGMSGVIDSVLGVDKKVIIENYLTRMRVKYTKAEGERWLNGCIFEINNQTGKAISVERLSLSENQM